MISSFKTDRSDRPDTRFCLKVLNQDPTCTFASWHYTTVCMWLDVWLVFNNDIVKFHFSYLHWSHKDILNINNIFSRTAARARWAADQQMRAFNRSEPEHQYNWNKGVFLILLLVLLKIWHASLSVHASPLWDDKMSLRLELSNIQFGVSGFGSNCRSVELVSWIKHFHCTLHKKFPNIVGVYRIWSNNSRGYYAKFEIKGGLLLLLKFSLIEIAEFC